MSRALKKDHPKQYIPLGTPSYGLSPNLTSPELKVSELPVHETLNSQTTIDDMDKLIQRLEMRGGKAGLKCYDLDIISDLLTLSKAVQTLRSSTTKTPNECSPSTSSEKLQEPPTSYKLYLRYLSYQEWELIQQKRMLEQRMDTWTNVINIQRQLENELFQIEREIDMLG